jgi:hypothetical protein
MCCYSFARDLRLADIGWPPAPRKNAWGLAQAFDSLERAMMSDDLSYLNESMCSSLRISGRILANIAILSLN